MTWPTDDHVKFKGLYTHRKMLGILLIFVLLGIFLVSILIMATSSMSGLRAYSTMQSYWTEARKDGTSSLIHYVETGESYHLDDFKKSTELIRDAQDLRVALMTDSPDYDTAREKLLAIHIHPRDIPSMIKVFERMHSLNHFSDAIQLWNESDNLIKDLEEIAGELTEISEGEPLEERQAEAYIGQILQVDERLREHKDVIAAGLSGGTRLLQNIIIWLSVSLVGILMLSGFLLSYRFLKKLKEWARILEDNEQRYKSLFEHNPHPVFSINKEGFFESGNESFKNLSGYQKKDLKELNIDRLLTTTIPIEGKKKLREVFNGNPQNFKTEWINRAGEKIPLQVTILPIYIDDAIEGAFFIAEDITFQKYAENKIKDQLKEKTFLLSEVHDRVKNNLALMLSLLQLQEQDIRDKKTRIYFERTTSRIRSMAMVHEELYKTESFASIRIDQFIRKVILHAKKDYLSQNTDLEISVNAKPLMMDIKQAIPFGLLLNELVMNIFKTAFEDVESGSMTISLIKEDDLVQIIINDNGTGRADVFDPDKTLPLGMTLIRTLMKNFKGELEFRKNSGIEAYIKFIDEENILRFGNGEGEQGGA